jgi:hypothetical protein
VRWRRLGDEQRQVACRPGVEEVDRRFRNGGRTVPPVESTTMEHVARR